MPRGSKSSYTPKQRRTASHIEKSVKARGGSEKEAERIGWATVNKEYGKAGTNKMKTKSSSEKGEKKSKSTSARKTSHPGATAHQ